MKADESRLRRMIIHIDEEDARSRYHEEAADNNGPDDSPGISSQEEERKFVAWEPEDPENPYNWSKVCLYYMSLTHESIHGILIALQKRKAFIVFTTMVTVINSTMSSALPSNATPYFTKEWGVTSQTENVLPISVFLVGESCPRSLCN